MVLKNQGNGPVTDEFWVDFYVDPEPVPTAVNQIWHEVASAGLVWEVTAAALPLEPGEVLTLTWGDEYSRPPYSHLPGPIPAGTPVYAQVDSYNAATTYGAVLEDHEILGEDYNNITGWVLPMSLSGCAIREVEGFNARR